MKLKEFTHSDITVKYAYLRSKSESKKALLVVLTNPFEKDGTIEFMHSLAPFDVPRLFIAAAKEYQYGLHLIKAGTHAPRDAILELIERTRIENGIEKESTYIIGFCMASQPGMAMAVENGYNLIITEYIFGGTLSKLWDDEDPEKIRFRAHQDEIRGPYMEFTYDEFKTRMKAFTGSEDSLEFIKQYFEEVKETAPEKFSVPKVFFLAGRAEESWRLFGEMTIASLRGFGLDVEVTVSSAEYGHMEAIPHFISFFTEKLRELGL